MKTRSSIRPLCSGADCLTFRSGRRKIRCGGLIRSSTDLRWCLPPNAMSYSEAALGSEVSRLNLVVFRGSSKIRPELSAVFSTHDLHRSTQPVAPIVLCFSMASQQHATSQFALTTLLVPRVQHQRTSRGLFFFWIGDFRLGGRSLVDRMRHSSCLRHTLTGKLCPRLGQWRVIRMSRHMSVCMSIRTSIHMSEHMSITCHMSVLACCMCQPHKSKGVR